MTKLAYRPREFAEATGLSVTQVRSLLRSGELRAIRSGRAVLITAEEAERWLRERAAATPQIR